MHTGVDAPLSVKAGKAMQKASELRMDSAPGSRQRCGIKVGFLSLLSHGRGRRLVWLLFLGPLTWHVLARQPSPGVLLIPQRLSIAAVIESLIVIWNSHDASVVGAKEALERSVSPVVESRHQGGGPHLRTGETARRKYQLLEPIDRPSSQLAFWCAPTAR